MKLLLDTHAFIWWIDDDPRLSTTARDAIADERSEVAFSIASGWELAIKVSIGRARYPARRAWFQRQLDRNGFTLLPVTLAHLERLTSLPFHHRDPFDRMLIAQAMVERRKLVTIDEAMTPYAAETLW